MAVCRKQRANERGATVRVALNAANITTVMSGLKMLVITLERAGQKGP